MTRTASDFLVHRLRIDCPFCHGRRHSLATHTPIPCRRVNAVRLARWNCLSGPVPDPEPADG